MQYITETKPLEVAELKLIARSDQEKLSMAFALRADEVMTRLGAFAEFLERIDYSKPEEVAQISFTFFEKFGKWI